METSSEKLSNAMGAVKCTECGRPMSSEEAKWRKCQMCGDPICLDHTFYLRVKRTGLYDMYYDAMRVCKKCRV